QTALHEGLKSVANAQDQLSSRFELPKRIRQVMLQLNAEDPARSNVVAVTETAGQAKDLVVGQASRRFQDPSDMQDFRNTVGALECMRGFWIAIGAGSTEDQSAWLHGRYHLSGFCQAAFNAAMSRSMTC